MPLLRSAAIVLLVGVLSFTLTACESSSQESEVAAEPPPPPYDGWSDPALSGEPWSASGAIEGLLTFRGSPTRSFYGRGMPSTPRVAWTFDVGCSNSAVGRQNKTWCGTGWTGQPSVFPAPGGDGWWVAFGGYDRNVNILDPQTGAPVIAPYATGDIIKGSVTIDPDGFPLLYTGSRDNDFHVVALDRGAPEALWKLNSEVVQPTRWNNDWDGSALIIDDYLFQGGENSRFFIVKLNRSYGPDSLVQVDPEIVFSTESWDEQLVADTGGSREQSIENSVVIVGNTVYFGNSDGLIQGFDLSGLKQGVMPERVFRFWAGEDVDATIVADDEGMLYVGVEYEKSRARAKEVGQILKLDPSASGDPVVWSVETRSAPGTGIWATPALHRDLVIVSTDDGDEVDGRVLGLDRATGQQRWELRLPGPLWQSPVVVDDVLVQGDCDGVLHGFDVSDTSQTPTELWSVELEGCIESTPAVWDGWIYIGTRAGTFYALNGATGTP